jgi:hypothetical protein
MVLFLAVEKTQEIWTRGHTITWQYINKKHAVIV